MQITINVDELRCARCGTTAPLLPHFLYLDGKIPPSVMKGLSNLFKDSIEISATDADGHTWRVTSEQKPQGWVPGPSSTDLCTTCGRLWEASGRVFLTPPPPPPKKRPEPLQAPQAPVHRNISRSKLTTRPASPTARKKMLTHVSSPAAKLRRTMLPLVERTTHGSSVVMIDREPPRPRRKKR